MDSIAPAAGAALVMSTLLQLAKNSKLVPFLTRDTGRLNALVSLLLAGFVALGLSYNVTFDQTTGAFTLGFSGTVGGVVDGLAHWIGQWSLQHATYKGLIAPAEILGESRAILRDVLTTIAGQAVSSTSTPPKPAA